MTKVIATQKLHTLCNGNENCHCPIITGDKACSIVTLINEFVSETNPVTLSFITRSEYDQFVLYCALVELVWGWKITWVQMNFHSSFISSARCRVGQFMPYTFGASVWMRKSKKAVSKITHLMTGITTTKVTQIKNYTGLKLQARVFLRPGM